MRDPKRIDRIIGMLRGYWHAHPDLRLGQIMEIVRSHLANTTREDAPDVFYIEDYLFESGLRGLVIKDKG